MYTKHEVIEILGSMKEDTNKYVVFIVGMVIKGRVYQMINEKIQEVMNGP